MRVRLTSDGAHDLGGTGVRVTMVTPTAADLAQDFHAAFCARVHFVVSEEAGRQWLSENPGGMVLSLEEGFAFALARNERVYGDALMPAAAT